MTVTASVPIKKSHPIKFNYVKVFKYYNWSSRLYFKICTTVMLYLDSTAYQ